MSNAAYSDLKACWHTEQITELRQGKQIVPRQVQLIISDLCNHDCHFCAYRMSGGFSTEQFSQDGNKNPNRKIATQKAMEILDDCSAIGVKAIQFTGGGEPTVHPDHIRLFDYAGLLGLQTSLVTNGCILREGWEAILPRMKWIRVSVDAGTAKTYSKVRSVKESMFTKVWTNIALLAEEIRNAGTDCLLGVGFVVTRENWKEIGHCLDLAKQAGVPYVRLSAMFSNSGESYYDWIYDSIRDKIEDMRTLYEDDVFKVVDLFGDRISDLHQHAPDYNFCGYQQFNMYIGGNLKVYRCCTTSYTKHGEVGDLSKQSFRKWFESEQKRGAYKGFDATTCHTCQFNGKNRAINYMLDADPLHAEFV